MLYSSMGFDKCIISCKQNYSITQISFTALNSHFTCLSLSFSFPEPLATTDHFIVFVFAFSRMSYNWNHTVYSLFILACSSMSFCGLVAHIFLLLTNVSLYGGTTVCLFIHILKDILVASSLG